jgi:protein SCO1/2
MTRTLVILIALIALAGQAEAKPSLPPILTHVGIDQRLDVQVPPDLEFRDEAGRTVRLGDYFQSEHKPVILVLAYYRCPRLCTEILNGLADNLRRIPLQMAEDYTVVTVSFDPGEKPGLAAAKKQAYIEKFGFAGAEAGWHFLTGDSGAIKRLTQAVGFRYAWDPMQKQFAHASVVTLLTPRGKIARYLFGIPDPEETNDLYLGLVDASNNKIGSRVRNVFLQFCYHYDPVTGKYTFAAMNMVRLGGVVTLVLLGVFLVAAWRRDAAKKRKAAVRLNGERGA